MSRLAKIEERLRVTPDDVFLNYSHAMELAKEDNLAPCRTAFARLRALDPDYVPAYFQEAQILARHGETSAARCIIQDGIAVARRVNDTHALREMTEFLESLSLE